MTFWYFSGISVDLNIHVNTTDVACCLNSDFLRYLKFYVNLTPCTVVSDQLLHLIMQITLTDT